MSFDGIVLTLLAVLAGLFVGFARQGRLLAVGATPVRAKSLLVIGIVVPALAERFTREVAVPLVVAGLAALFAFAIVNVRVVGMSVLAVGVLANLLATFLNGGIPVSRDALVEAGLASRSEVDRVELRGARRLEEPTQRLRFLGDIIPLRETSQVLSFGDLVVLVGLADITANLTLRRRARRRTGAVADAEAGADPSASAEYFDDDEFALPDVEEWLFATTISKVTAEGERPDPRPVPRTRPAASPEREVAVSFADLLGPDLIPELVDDPGPVVGHQPVVEPAPAVAGSGPDVAWWPIAVARDPDPTFEVASSLDVAAEPEPVEVAAPPAPVLDVVIDISLEREPEPEPEVAVEVEIEIAVAAEPEPVEIEIEISLEPEPAPAVAPAVIDLRDDPDDLLRAIFADLTPRRRTRRRSGVRNIPDFEPIHLDDALTGGR